MNMSQALVKLDDNRLCHKCWNHVGRSRWAVGVPVFGRLCEACFAPVKQAMLSRIRAKAS